MVFTLNASVIDRPAMSPTLLISRLIEVTLVFTRADSESAPMARQLGQERAEQRGPLVQVVGHNTMHLDADGGALGLRGRREVDFLRNDTRIMGGPGCEVSVCLEL